jgi:hypothetical protein
LALDRVRSVARMFRDSWANIISIIIHVSFAL